MFSHTIPRNGGSSTRLPFERALAHQLLGWQDSAEAGAYAPRADVVETQDHLVVCLELAGVNAEDIDVHLDKDIVTITAERKPPETGQGAIYHHSELAYGTFSRAFKLPGNVDRDGIDAAYVDGMLTVTLPKSEDSKPRTIAVKSR